MWPKIICVPCPIVSFSSMLDDGIIRCGGRFSLNEVLTDISVCSSPEITQAIASSSPSHGLLLQYYYSESKERVISIISLLIQ